MLLQASSGNFVKVWTPEHTDSFVLFEFEVLTKPEIELQGNGMTISSGDTVPGTADDTDFGNVSLSSNALRTFTILNTDVGDLTIGTITFSGTNLGDFSVSSAPASTVSGNSSTTFDITFTPSEGGLRTATVSIPHNDNDDNENPYTFAIQGSGAAISVIPVSGLITTEAGGTDTFAVSLSTDPSAAVTVPLSSSNTAEGNVPASLVFNPGGALTQTVTVTGVNDDVDDGDQNYTIIVGAAISTDNGFSGIDPPDVSVSNQDDDTAGFTITESDGTTEVEESGTTDTFDVVLTAQPLSDVVITVSSGNTGEATVNQAMLTFTSGDWNQAQTVTVTGVDEFVEDGDQTTTITLSIDDANSDDTFDPLADQTVSVTTIDDDAAGFSITESDGTTEVEESGTADTFDVVLTAQPLSDVVITVSSDDTEEATVDQAMLTFTSANWDITQTVTVTGVDESVDDGDQTTTITLSIDDANSDDTFDPLADQTVSVTTIDDENDGDDIPADVEDRGPNNGDGNFDSIPDRIQGNVVSLPNAVNGDYVTLAVGGGCDQIDNVNVAAEAAMGADPFYDYPLGLLGFELPCSSAQITVFYHSQNGLVGREYRKYGPFIPTSLFSLQFYTLPEVSFGTSNGVTTATFSLSDGMLGDDNTATGANDGKIIDPGGPARSALEPLPAAPIPTLQPWGITLLGLFLAGALARFSRRRRT
ncbi:MAG: IPTL-CTERM sorting domain-containing protein [Gammaproteobacteria bacterium]